MVDERVSWGIKSAAAIVAAMWGGFGPLLQALIVLMAVDITTGFLAGFVTRQLNSDVSFRGMAKKAIILLIVATATVSRWPGWCWTWWAPTPAATWNWRGGRSAWRWPNGREG